MSYIRQRTQGASKEPEHTHPVTKHGHVHWHFSCHHIRGIADDAGISLWR
jgi:hypothetical protein